MNDEEIKLIAEAHGWKYHLGLKGAEFYVSTPQEAAIKLSSGEWHLTDAGAFRVLVETPSLHLIKYDHEFWEVEWFPNYTRVYKETPHEAIAQARLAQLNA